MPHQAPSIIHEFIDQLPEELPRRVIDGMGKARVAAGPVLEARLLHTAPEDRTWLEGLEVGALSSTDFIDGFVARLIGTTEEGREIDREGDRGFVMPQQRALTANGEVPPIHYALKTGREHAMKGLRWWGERNGKDLASREVNRQKTFAEMSTLTAANSPLATHADLIRWGASVGTALSLTGLVETGFDYLRSERDEPVENARNSSARELSDGPRGRLAKFIDRKLPGVTPAHLTQWGKRGVEASAAAVALFPDHPVLPTVGFTVGSLLDTLDGALAREKGIDSIDGMIEDVQADLEQQIAALAALSIVARRRQNRVAAANYAVATMTSSLSALTRAEAESRGLIVAEGGLGTRVGRAIITGAGMGFNRYQDASDILSATLATGTINTVLERRDAVRQGLVSPHTIGINTDPAFMHEAEARKEAIVPYALKGLAIGSALLLTPHRSGGRPQTAESPSDSSDTGLCPENPDA